MKLIKISHENRGKNENGDKKNAAVCGGRKGQSVVDSRLGGLVLFENLPELMKPEAVAQLLGVSVLTIYDWKYRQRLRGAPNGLFIKLNRLLYLRTEVLRQWISSQNPSLD